MTKQQAEKELAKNMLNMQGCGLDGLPCKRVLIETFQVVDDDEDYKRINLIGLYGKRNDKASRQWEKIIYSFLIQEGWNFWFRDYFCEAMDVIEAIRVRNDYKTD